MKKHKTTTRAQVVKTLVDYLLESHDPRILEKIEGIASNDSSFEITFNEGAGFFTNFRVTVSEPELFELEEEDD